jgi:hypothetical protein
VITKAHTKSSVVQDGPSTKVKVGSGAMEEKAFFPDGLHLTFSRDKAYGIARR